MLVISTQNWSILAKFTQKNPANSAVFYWLLLGEVSPPPPEISREFAPENPSKFDFFPLKSRKIGRFFCEIWLFFRENPTKLADFSTNFDFFPAKIPRKSCEIGWFFREFAPENPAKFCFFFREALWRCAAKLFHMCISFEGRSIQFEKAHTKGTFDWPYSGIRITRNVDIHINLFYQDFWTSGILHAA